MKKQEEHLPLYGVGPIYGIIIIFLTVLGCVLSAVGLLDSFQIEKTKILFRVIGVILLIEGFLVWYKGAFKIDKYIKSNELCTEGIYSWVRNPCYSGIMLMCNGFLFLANNLFLLVLPILYWIFMTVLMKNTEEKWLEDLYGETYRDYCKKVNRCIPFPSGKKSRT